MTVVCKSAILDSKWATCIYLFVQTVLSRASVLLWGSKFKHKCFAKNK